MKTFIHFCMCDIRNTYRGENISNKFCRQKWNAFHVLYVFSINLTVLEETGQMDAIRTFPNLAMASRPQSQLWNKKSLPTLDCVEIRFVFVGFEVFTAVVMKSIIFWDMTPCSTLSCTRRIGGTSGATQRTTRRHIPEDDTLQICFYSFNVVFYCNTALKYIKIYIYI
jgi:hypothetical protein